MGKPRSYSKHTVMGDFIYIYILAAMLQCTCYSDTSYKQGGGLSANYVQMFYLIQD